LGAISYAPSPASESNEEHPKGQLVNDFISNAIAHMNRSQNTNHQVPFRVRIFRSYRTLASENSDFIVNPDTLDQWPANRFAASLCHEIAHLSRMHEHRARKELALSDFESEYKTLIQEIIVPFMSKHFSNNSYQHDPRLIEATQQQWKDRGGLKLLTLGKKMESEADVVGGFICGLLGMNPNSYVEGALSNLQKSHPTPECATLNAPTSCSFSGIPFFASMLMITGSQGNHPTDPERREQLEKLKSSFRQGNSPYIGTWIASFDRVSR
jgi:predicted SprT family Zn-dependent metalloprotease